MSSVHSTVLFPGTFDFLTKGHEALIKRSADLFSNVIVAIAANPRKVPVFSLAEHVALASHLLKPLNNVEVCGFEGLLAKLARQKGPSAFIRGLRSDLDVQCDFKLAKINKHLAPDIETLF